MNLHSQSNSADLAQRTFDYPFRILPYFSIIIRAIGELEGIALVGNPYFAIVDEASYPYIAQSLLTEETPRLRNALRFAIYGKSGVFDTERFIHVMQASENFTTAAKSWGGENMNGNMAELSRIFCLSQTSQSKQGLPYDFCFFLEKYTYRYTFTLTTFHPLQSTFFIIFLRDPPGILYFFTFFIPIFLFRQKSPKRTVRELLSRVPFWIRYTFQISLDLLNHCRDDMIS